ncbi:probable membrane-associated kinase regulator 1 [Durio zibethinus]|uniref:Probable membrane-associated kinase regulator 1 n=1 Tax=Durio zibethinus TaxID=66656 RepID=A0A6P5Z901_DURZI|nr:probable membrane-associated kinase regulator 1 [Durio zibethinus]
MGKRREKLDSRSSQTLPSSPSHSFSSSSSSDFEFTISLSPRANSSSTLCPADDLFYKGQLLPLHLSPRLSMVRTLLLASSSTSSFSETSSATASRDSVGSSNDSHSSFASDLVLLADCDSSRPSSVTEDDELKRLNNGNHLFSSHQGHHQIKKSKYFSFSRFSSVFKKENNKNRDQENMPAASSVKKMSTTAKEVIRKYLKKVKPLYEKLSQKPQQKMGGTGVVSALSSTTSGPASFSIKPERSVKDIEKINARKESNNAGFFHSFSGNLRYPRRRSCISSCPSSMRSSPSHSGVLSRHGLPRKGMYTGRVSGGGGGSMYYLDTSSMDELQSAIQSAITHCKNSLLQNKTTVVSNEI